MNQYRIFGLAGADRELCNGEMRLQQPFRIGDIGVGSGGRVGGWCGAG